MEREFFPVDQKKFIKEIGKEGFLSALKKMLMIRNFETRAESAYLHTKIGGFFHSYAGQEAIQTAAVEVMGKNQWWITSYRCHALALLLGATPNEVMAELYGRATGNALGRGGSMHLYTETMLGGFGIVAGQVPVATGAAFSIKYLNEKDKVAICFLGDGAMAQGAFHEALNLASLWDLPCIYVVENNLWGMGTSIERAISVEKLAEQTAPSYNMQSYTFDGMDFINCYAGFQHVFQEVVKTSRPVLIEAITERFKGHSVSDPGLYRTKEALEEAKKRDPILVLRDLLEKEKWMNEETFKNMDHEQREIALAAMKYADESPWPDLNRLEEGVFVPWEGMGGVDG